MNHTILGLALGLTALDRAKQRNASFGEVLIWEEFCRVLAERARERVIKHAIKALVADGHGIGASFVRNVVKAGA